MGLKAGLELYYNRLDGLTLFRLMEGSASQGGVVFMTSVFVDEGLERLVDARHLVVRTGVGIDIGMVTTGEPPICFADRLGVSFAADAH